MSVRPAGAGGPVDLLRALAVFAERPGPEHEAVADALELGRPADGQAHAQLFSLQLYPYGSVYLGPEGMLGGEATDRVAGFWGAVGRVPPAEPDHLSALLGLYASLLEEEGGAAGPERSLIGASRAALLHEHLAPWVFSFLHRVEVLGSDFHARWAVLLGQVLRLELERGPRVTGLPLQLREAPGLPDPREEGGRAFLDGLVAPVRTGMILCRADVSRIGSSLGLGVRMGERRYVLEHLIGQDPSATLAALAAEARTWTDYHLTQVDALGESASFMAERSRATEELMGSLAADRESALRPEAEAGT